MSEEFLDYLSAKIGPKLISSFQHTDLLLWGARSDSSVKLLGVTLNVGVTNDASLDLTVRQNKRIITCAKIAFSLSKQSGLAFFLIGYPISGGTWFHVTSPLDPLNTGKPLVVRESSLPKTIQENFNTSFGTSGTNKAVNKSTSDWFQVWARENLPREYVRLNIDGLIVDSNNEPKILLETKRSYISVDNWEPWENDSRNYCLQDKFCKKNDLNFLTIYHIKGISVVDNSRVGLFSISNVCLESYPWIEYDKSVVAAFQAVTEIENLSKS